jgi:aminoglycoside phosphotransferase (APT) family kinase protein
MQERNSISGALRDIADQALPGTSQLRVERMTSGASTPVYRIQRDAVTCYLRLAEEPGASLAPEVLVHQWLSERGVRVPEVVYFEPFNENLQRSVMVTTEIAGRSLADHHCGIDVARVLVAAGGDLAAINAIPVSGFGFVRRDHPHATSLEGEFPTWREFALGELEAHFAALPVFLDGDEIATIRRLVNAHASLLDTEQAVLAHGDFDVTHIYHLDGDYSGIIDFGEIRGADPLYDLGHFALHDGEIIPDSLLPHLLAGYHQVTRLVPDHEYRIRLGSLLIGVRALARSAARPRSAYQNHLVRAVRHAVAEISRL